MADRPRPRRGARGEPGRPLRDRGRSPRRHGRSAPGIPGRRPPRGPECSKKHWPECAPTWRSWPRPLRWAGWARKGRPPRSRGAGPARRARCCSSCAGTPRSCGSWCGAPRASRSSTPDAGAASPSFGSLRARRASRELRWPPTGRDSRPCSRSTPQGHPGSGRLAVEAEIEPSSLLPHAEGEGPRSCELGDASGRSRRPSSAACGGMPRSRGRSRRDRRSGRTAGRPLDPGRFSASAARNEPSPSSTPWPPATARRSPSTSASWASPSSSAASPCSRRAAGSGWKRRPARNRACGTSSGSSSTPSASTTVGRLAAGIAHEINNPLEGMANYLVLARDALARKRRLGGRAPSGEREGRPRARGGDRARRARPRRSRQGPPHSAGPRPGPARERALHGLAEGVRRRPLRLRPRGDRRSSCAGAR